MSTERMADIRDLLYRIEAALDDVDNDLADADSPDDVRAALDHLYSVCTGVRTASTEPVAVALE